MRRIDMHDAADRIAALIKELSFRDGWVNDLLAATESWAVSKSDWAALAAWVFARWNEDGGRDAGLQGVGIGEILAVVLVAQHGPPAGGSGE